MRHSLEFVFQPETQAILDHFCGLVGVRIAFFSPEGKERQVGKGRSMCDYCRMIRGKLGYDVLCRTLDASVSREVAKSGRLKSYVCHGGMIEAVMPVVVSGRTIGFIMIGQFRRRDKPPATILRKSPPGLRSRIERAYARTPRMTADQLRHTLGMFELLVRYVSDRRLVTVHDAIEPILHRLRESPESRVSLQEAAAFAGCSPAVLSRLFRKTLGKSYSQTRTELLLDRADELFREHPGILIQDVAYRLGFDDPLYFSRLYRKKRGVCARVAAQRHRDAAPSNASR